ncbi:hypothetical protein JHK82_037230 [Glycine max]|nr:hypothetical protein JHK82_037230 [Glycine max]
MDDIELPMFDFNTITMATDNFSEANKLGQGGFGIVYRVGKNPAETDSSSSKKDESWSVNQVTVTLLDAR